MWEIRPRPQVAPVSVVMFWEEVIEEEFSGDVELSGAVMGAMENRESSSYERILEGFVSVKWSDWLRGGGSDVRLESRWLGVLQGLFGYDKL